MLLTLKHSSPTQRSSRLITKLVLHFVVLLQLVVNGGLPYGLVANMSRYLSCLWLFGVYTLVKLLHN